MWQKTWSFIFVTFFRPVLKWLIHRLTGKCELLRILDSTEQGAKRTFAIENSLRLSKCPSLSALLKDDNVDVDKAVQDIIRIKNIKTDVYKEFPVRMKACLDQIVGYRSLLEELETQRREAFSSDNSEHEKYLITLWDKLCPEVDLESRISKQWGDIGFQGDDPMTDFRGMGLLGLKNLIYLVTRHTDSAKTLLSHSHHPRLGYSFAIAGINLTALTFDLYRKGHLKVHFYNTVNGKPTMDHFSAIYSQIFWDFDEFYRAAEPRDMMEFNIIKEKFHKYVLEMLHSCVDYKLSGTFLNLQ